jgi:hypothetical protein
MATLLRRDACAKAEAMRATKKTDSAERMAVPPCK